MNEEELHCKHFVVRKKRFCRMTVKKGEEYCGEHQINSCEPVDSKNLDKSKQRVICPLDNKQLSCYIKNILWSLFTIIERTKKCFFCLFDMELFIK